MIKKLLGLLILVCLFFPGFSQYSDFILISPTPDSRFINPEQSILIKTDQEFDDSSIMDSMFSIVGSESGIINFRIKISDDNKSIILIPERYFAFGEIVTVNISLGLKSKTGNFFSEMCFSFKIKKSETLSLLRKYRQSPQYDFYIAPSDYSDVEYSEIELKDNNLPIDYPEPTFAYYNNENPDDKYIFINLSTRSHPIYNPYLTIWDKFGTPIYYERMPNNCMNFYVLQDGTLTYSSTSIMHPENEKYYLMDSSYVVFDSVLMGNGYFVDNHDLRLLDNGNYLVFSYDPQIVDMSQIVPGGNPQATVIGLVIQEVDLNQNVYFQWRSWDHFEITDATSDIDLTASEIDYVHGNAMEIDNDGNILLSSRNMDEITKIDFNTGNIIWRFGKNAENNMFDIFNDPTGFSHQHDIRKIFDGRYSIYDNGNLHNPPFSQALEYMIDEENLQAYLVWDYQRTGVYAWATGSYRRYEDGRRLIGWGTHDPLNVTELNPDGSLAYDISVPTNISTYRAQKFNWETNMFGSEKNISFGNYAGHEGPKEILIYVNNYSMQGIKITSTYNHLNEYAVTTQLPVSIMPGVSEIIKVIFEPLDTGEYEDILTLNYDFDDNSKRIAIQVNLEGVWDEEIPSVFFDPDNGSINIDPNTAILVTFDEPVRKILGDEILNEDIPNLFHFHKDNYLGENIEFSGIINDDKTVITIYPDNQLLEEQQYYIEMLANRIEDFDGNIITNAEVSYFTTGLIIGTNEEAIHTTRIFPNPFHDQLNIRLIDKRERKFILYDLTGECVLNLVSASDNIILETGNLNPGMYFLRVSENASDIRETFKMIKK